MMFDAELLRVRERGKVLRTADSNHGCGFVV